MGLFRKSLSVSTLGAIDLRSDKERIARSTRKGAKGQQETNRLLTQQNKILNQTQRPATASNPVRGWDFVYGVPSHQLWAAVTDTFSSAEVRARDDAARSIEAKTQGCIATATVGDQPQGSGLRLRTRATGFSKGPGSDKQVQEEWARLRASIEGKLPLDAPGSAVCHPGPHSDALVNKDLVAQLGRLADMHASGLLTDNQYEAAKDKLIDS